MAINERNYVGFALSPSTGRPHRIRHLPVMAEWEPGVYLYEAGDKFVADVDGIDNLPGQQLANRTEFLKEQNALLASACKGLVAIVRETTVGKISSNGYRVVLSRDRPKEACAWVHPTDNLGNLVDSLFYVRDTSGNLWQNPVVEFETEEGVIYYVGGTGDSFPHILTVIGSVGLTLSGTDPQQRTAWVRVAGESGQVTDASSKVVLDDGTALSNPTFQVVSDEDNVYYIRTYAPDPEPLYEETVEINGFDVATHGDIDALTAR